MQAEEALRTVVATAGRERRRSATRDVELLAESPLPELPHEPTEERVAPFRHQYQRPRANPPNATSPMSATMSPIQKLQKIQIRIPATTSTPPSVRPAPDVAVASATIASWGGSYPDSSFPAGSESKRLSQELASENPFFGFSREPKRLDVRGRMGRSRNRRAGWQVAAGGGRPSPSR
jgi:hypothetical protein